MIHIEGIHARVRRAVEARDARFLNRLGRALKSLPAPQKHTKVGLTLNMLWEAGLKRLTYRQIREFLRVAGFSDVPSLQGLERYAQRLRAEKVLDRPGS